MPSFRKSSNQAAYVVRQQLAIGRARHSAKDDGKIHSVGTARNYQQALKGVADWLQYSKSGSLKDITLEQAMEYLEMRACAVRQSTLDLDRQALQSHLGEAIPRIKSEIETHRGSRLYTSEQLEMIRSSQTPRNALTTELAERCGIRAHEALTIRRIAEQPPSTHREWRPEILAVATHTVIGKGGLCRPIVCPADLASRLEVCRHSTSRTVTDRGVRYQNMYNIGGGNAWSKSFSEASKRALGYSLGAHSCRHVYVQTTLKELSAGTSSLSPGQALCREDCRAVVMNLVGHWRDLCEAYLR